MCSSFGRMYPEPAGCHFSPPWPTRLGPKAAKKRLRKNSCAEPLVETRTSVSTRHHIIITPRSLTVEESGQSGSDGAAADSWTACGAALPDCPGSDPSQRGHGG